MARKYTTTGQAYNGTKQVSIDDLCCSFTVLNKGNTKVTFNGIPINPNDSVDVRGEADWFFGGRADLAFDATGVTAPVNQVWVIQLIDLGWD